MNTKLRLIASLINFFVIAVADTLSPDLQMYWENSMVHPYFDNTTKRDVTAIAGQTCQLHCRVKSLGDRAVSWIRKRDLHILTVGILTYTNDQRFQSLHTEGSDEWTLRITSPQARDSGVYECQVSTEPKISQAFRLNVVVSKAKILGNAELFVKSGSDINLTCVALQSPQPPSFIYWYKGGRVINYSQRGGISVLTEQQTRTSRLVIARASPSDSGNYTCTPSNSDSASVVVHVIKGEHPAAMQHGVNHAKRVHKSEQIIVVLALALLCIQLLDSRFPNRNCPFSRPPHRSFPTTTEIIPARLRPLQTTGGNAAMRQRTGRSCLVARRALFFLLENSSEVVYRRPHRHPYRISGSPRQMSTNSTRASLSKSHNRESCASTMNGMPIG
nr:hemicentin-1-like isoform X1 [Aedes albopictus]XP_029718414.1 hemicentin-1-like isoform X1 [Aedes albopictus]XP_029718415.1 hemicentin-1-like isoform X1 [Aedes albopictus]XP_029718416.1 hemicentin-1-like isoform X1 [Aedes albopictus]